MTLVYVKISKQEEKKITNTTRRYIYPYTGVETCGLVYGSTFFTGIDIAKVQLSVAPVHCWVISAVNTEYGNNSMRLTARGGGRRGVRLALKRRGGLEARRPVYLG